MFSRSILIPTKTIMARGTVDSAIDTARFIQALGGVIDTFKELDNGEWVVWGKVPMEPLTHATIEREVNKAVGQLLDEGQDLGLKDQPCKADKVSKKQNL